MNLLLRKDLLSMLRQKHLAAAYVMFVAISGGLVLASWPQQGVVSLTSGAQDNLLLGLMLGQVALLALFETGVGAVMLSGEREAGTIELLYASRLSPRQIIFGKVASCLGFPVLLLASTLPFMGLLTWRGTTNLGQVGTAYLILLLSGLLLAMIALAVSACCRQSSSALVISYLIVLGLYGALLVPAALMLENQSGSLAAVLHYARGLSPISAILALLRPNPGDFDGLRHHLAPLWQVFIPVSLALDLICFLIVAMRLSRPPLSRQSKSRNHLDAPPGARRLARWRRLLVLVDPAKPRRPIGMLSPMLAKEIRTNRLHSGRWMIRTFYAALCLALLLSLMSLSSGAEDPDLLQYVVSVLVSLQIGLILMVVPSLTSAGVSGEFESDTFQMLRLAPLTSGRVFWGKLLPALPVALLPIAALLPAYATLCFIDPNYWPYLLRLAPILGLAVLFCAAAGLTCSTFTTSSARSTVAGYLIAAGLFGLPLIAWFAAGEQLNIRVANWLAMASPLVMSLSAVAHGAAGWSSLANFWLTHLVLIGSLCALLVIIARWRVGQLLKCG